MSRIIRVFPHKTKMTPHDPLVRVATPPGMFDEADEVHVSVAFSWDIPAAERLAEDWKVVAPVKVGGPAYGQPGGEFVTGMYLREGCVITSRGCPNHCWFCSVWKREPGLIELPIKDGWNLFDDNLLACSDDHIRSVFAMLARQPHRAKFTGGLEARLLKPWHAEAIAALKPAGLYFAYDTPDDWEPLKVAAEMMHEAGISTKSHKMGCYVLCGYKGDTQAEAEHRMQQVLSTGLTPFAMLYRDQDGKRDPAWRQWAKQWIRPTIIYATEHGEGE